MGLDDVKKDDEIKGYLHALDDMRDLIGRLERRLIDKLLEMRKSE